ncbi:MAG: hypothetical protein ISS28_06895, partial [Candidatus Cloacimonetes bacterium]|nr:hypothetical protein [Candidatus Cloacimonadota bacterium]
MKKESIQKIKVIFNEKVFRLRYFLIIILLATILFLLFNTEYLYEKKKFFETEHTVLGEADQFTFLPENPFYDVVYLKESESYLETNINYRNLNTGSLRQVEMVNFSISSKCFYDSTEKAVYTIMTEGTDYYLYELYNQENTFVPKQYKIFHYDIYDSLQDTTIIIKNIKFYQFKIDNNIKDNCEVKEYEDGYRLIFTQSIKDSINEKYYTYITKIINNKLRTDLTIFDLYEFIQFNLRNLYYHKKYFSKPDYQSKSFFPAYIMGMIDANNDGIKEILIKVEGTRWINDLLICYCKETQEIVWKKEFAQGIEDFLIYDIDNDGENEILFASYSPSIEMPYDSFKKEMMGTTNQSNFYILNNKGEIKKINKKPALIIKESHFSQFRYLLLNKQQKILLGLFSNHDNLDKRLLLFDLKENKVDSLDIIYQNIISFYKENGNIIAINSLDNELKKIIISEKFRIKKVLSKKVTERYEGYKQNYCKIDNVVYLILTYPHIILNKRLKFLYQFPSNIDVNNAKWKDNDIYFIEHRTGKNYLSKLHFERNKTINPYVIMILLFEILLIATYYLVHQFIAIPITSGLKSYLIVYSLFNKLHFWKIYGKMKKIYTLPK